MVLRGRGLTVFIGEGSVTSSENITFKSDKKKKNSRRLKCGLGHGRRSRSSSSSGRRSERFAVKQVVMRRDDERIRRVLALTKDTPTTHRPIGCERCVELI